jgi:hypothetical protein
MGDVALVVVVAVVLLRTCADGAAAGTLADARFCRCLFRHNACSWARARWLGLQLTQTSNSSKQEQQTGAATAAAAEILNTDDTYYDRL